MTQADVVLVLVTGLQGGNESRAGTARFLDGTS